jgi:DNA end-binding protein Ku
MAALKESLERARAGAGFERDADDSDGSDGSDAGSGAGLDDLSRDELYERAQKEDVPGRSSMSRKELIEALSG